MRSGAGLPAAVRSRLLPPVCLPVVLAHGRRSTRHRPVRRGIHRW
ncbi:hypothetical protein SBD_0105 [Streptomyces bottropensis ATCC 25435]|uniref:Uncharacterized protein n=1 Tax=Streptomyces bottropensis ATCC 25435 TaxID=1054862 RepID=M3F729_9ACTN|nr:hypothetical protein SBD_0105 [Streptomyces bottropensis ATCC 25435]